MGILQKVSYLVMKGEAKKDICSEATCVEEQALQMLPFSLSTIPKMGTNEETLLGP